MSSVRIPKASLRLYLDSLTYQLEAQTAKAAALRAEIQSLEEDIQKVTVKRDRLQQLLNDDQASRAAPIGGPRKPRRGRPIGKKVNRPTKSFKGAPALLRGAFA